LGVLMILSVGISAGLARLAQAQILRKAARADPESVPQVYASLNRCYAHLPYVPVDVLVIDSPRLNAYTFGLDHPYTVILSSGLLESLSENELTTVIGHELGHALYEHTFLSSVLGGMLYRRGLASLAWSLVFLRWRRLAERTADRIAYLSSGQLDVCIRTMISLATGGNGEIDAEIDEVLAQVYADERSELFERLDGLVRTHPNLVARVRALIEFDAELFALDVENWLAADG
jgi:Zn-dependent protease with chaperone function